MSERAPPSLINRIRLFKDTDQRTPLLLPGSPFAVGLKATLISIDAQARGIRVSFTPGIEYVAARGTLQGGAVATMLDLTMAFMALALIPEDRSTSTANLNISYLKPAFPGPMIGEGEVERLGRSMIFLRARLVPEGGDAVASATGVFAIFERKPSGLPA